MKFAWNEAVNTSDRCVRLVLLDSTSTNVHLIVTWKRKSRKEEVEAFAVGSTIYYKPMTLSLLTCTNVFTLKEHFTHACVK